MARTYETSEDEIEGFLQTHYYKCLEDKMFEYDSKLVGGRGTTISSSGIITSNYARIDNPSTEPGYFTYKEIL